MNELYFIAEIQAYASTLVKWRRFVFEIAVAVCRGIFLLAALISLFCGLLISESMASRKLASSSAMPFVMSMTTFASKVGADHRGRAVTTPP